MKVLQICHKMPYPLLDGGAYSLFHTALGLIYQQIDIKILAINTPRNWVDINSVPLEFIKNSRLEYSIADTRFKPFRAFLNLFSERSYLVERFFSEEYNARLIEILKDEAFDVIQLEHVYMCLYLETIRKYSKAKVFLRPQNVENKVWKRFLEKESNPFKKLFLLIAALRLEKFEKRVTPAVDGIIAISSEDEEIFILYAPDVPCIHVPAGFDFSKTKSYDYNTQFIKSPVFYHIGSMDWGPNEQGMRWFIQDIMPYIKKEYPEFVFRIAGKKMPAYFFEQEDRNLIVDGEVDDALKYHEDKTIMIVPVLSGGGIRVKIIEAMALGKTIISTTIGAEGIPYTDGENILIADTREEFATQINKCIHLPELGKKIGANAKLLATENYDCNTTAKNMIQFYKRIIKDLTET